MSTDIGLHQIFAEVARRQPDAVAVVAGDRMIGYRELDERSTAWAAELSGEGLAPGQLMPIALPRSADLVTALLAVLKCGAAYALIDPGWPEPRISETCRQLGAAFVICDGEPPRGAGRGWWPKTPARMPASGFTPVPVASTAPCCVFFTSGTTGLPKGVLSTHGATARLFGTDSFAPFGPGTIIPLAAPTPWDAFSLELWGALLTGGTSVVIEEPFLSAASVRDGVARHDVNTAWLTSSLFNMIVDEDCDAFAGMRIVMIGGERLSTDHVRRFLERHPSVTLLNGYGPVENTIFATTHRIGQGDPERPGGIPLGRAVAGTGVWVLDGVRPCAPGEPGEICLDGTGIAVRYLLDERRTAESFPALELDGLPRRVYRTGDLGRWAADGLLEFLGRADRQVKIRGHRVEPAEVERQVERLLPAVRRCHVAARRDTSGNVRDLLAFCIPRQPADPLSGAEAMLRQQMVHYQCPSAVVSVPALPLTAQGKLDERALLALAPATHEGDTEHVSSAAEVLETTIPDTTGLIAAAFSAVLRLPQVSAVASFFDLGGDSLQAGRACARLGAQLNRPVPVSRLYQFPTAAGLARWLDAEPHGVTRPAVAHGSPLTPMQLAFLTRHLAAPEGRTNHCLLTWLIEGELDPRRLEDAIACVFDRHEPLRAAYVADPQPAAVLTDLAPPALEILPPESTPELALASLRTVAGEPLDPLEGDVLRTLLVPVAGPATWILGCVVHHLAFDGWSEAVFARDLADAYNGRPARPAPPTLAQVTAQLSALEAEADIHAQVVSARTALSAIRDIRWPGPAPVADPHARADEGPGESTGLLPPSIVTAIDTTASAHNLTRFTVVFAAWARAVSRATGSEAFAVGVPVAQRSTADLADSIGCHISMAVIPVTQRMLGGCVPETLEAAGRTVRAAFAVRDAPIGALIDPALPRTRRRPAPFQILFALQDNAAPHLPLDRARTRFLRQRHLDLPVEFQTELWPTPDGNLRIVNSHLREVVPERTTRAIAEGFTEQLRTLTKGPVTLALSDRSPTRRPVEP